MSITSRKHLIAGVLGLGLVVVPLIGQVSAQTTGEQTRTAGANPAIDTGATTNRTTHEEGFNPGWLGLLGLVGLAGLMPKKTPIHTVTTPRTGEGPVR